MKFCIAMLTLLTLSGGLHAQRKSAPRDRVIVSDDRYLVTYAVTKREVVFTMEDFRAAETGAAWKQNMPGSWFQILVDVNRNGKVDRNVDVTYGVYKNDLSLCPQYLIDERASTQCGGFNSAAYYEKSSRRTQNTPYRHIVHRFTIPRSELSAGKTKEIRVVLHCVTEGDPFYSANSFYPVNPTSNAHSFDKTLKLRL